ncbi:MAG: ATP phosphoribosyltransferase [Dehalococcoidia bacterium]
MLRLALPSNPEWQEPTLAFLESCGLPVQRRSSRRYTGSIPSLPDSVVLFQRVADIPAKVEDGTVDLGIAGFDRFCEVHTQDGDGLPLVEDLGFRKAELVIGAPESWLDVTSLADLAEIALELREKGKQLRIATKYPRLVERFLLSRNITHFLLVEAGGAVEAAPAMGYADIIADITSSGTTLRENRLKTIQDGTIFTSQACLLGNRRRLAEDPEALSATRTILELMEARLRASTYYSIIANIRGGSPEEVAAHVRTQPETAGIQGPTISRVYSKDEGEGWYAVTIVVEREAVMPAVEHLRRIGGNGITVSPTTYVFEDKCQAYERLQAALRGVGEEK